jgi:hypothetical protein
MLRDVFSAPLGTAGTGDSGTVVPPATDFLEADFPGSSNQFVGEDINSG